MGERKKEVYIASSKEVRKFYKFSRVTGDIYDLLPEKHKAWFKSLREGGDGDNNINGFDLAEPPIRRRAAELRNHVPSRNSRAIRQVLVNQGSYHTRFNNNVLLQLFNEVQGIANYRINPVDTTQYADLEYFGITSYYIAFNGLSFRITDLDRSLEAYINDNNDDEEEDEDFEIEDTDLDF